MSDYTLYNADCLDVLPTLEPQSVDAVICDPPYGTTACKWDSVIPFAPMWAGIRHVLKPRGACVLFGQEPFASCLRVSNLSMYRYDWTWEKTRTGKFAQAPYRPLAVDEKIIVFSTATCTKNSRVRMTYNPRTVLRVSSTFGGAHPTQKPLALLEYLVKTYTNAGDCVLDFTMGSGTTGHACGNLGRRFVGIEKDAGYFAIAQERIATAYAPLRAMQVAV